MPKMPTRKKEEKAKKKEWRNKEVSKLQWCTNGKSDWGYWLRRLFRDDDPGKNVPQYPDPAGKEENDPNQSHQYRIEIEINAHPTAYPTEHPVCFGTV